MKPSGADTSEPSRRRLAPLSQRARTGFSLLELMLVLGLVATVSASLAVLGRGGSGGRVADVGAALVARRWRRREGWPWRGG